LGTDEFDLDVRIYVSDNRKITRNASADQRRLRWMAAHFIDRVWFHRESAVPMKEIEGIPQ
jgi:hypothetical protein